MIGSDGQVWSIHSSVIDSLRGWARRCYDGYQRKRSGWSKVIVALRGRPRDDQTCQYLKCHPDRRHFCVMVPLYRSDILSDGVYRKLGLSVSHSGHLFSRFVQKSSLPCASPFSSYRKVSFVMCRASANVWERLRHSLPPHPPPFLKS